MSKAARQSIFILIILLLGSAGFAGYLVIEKQKLEKTQSSLREQITDLETREKKVLAEKKKLEDQLQETDIAKKKFESDVNTLNEQIQQFNTQINDLTKERDDWKSRVDTIQQERDQLVAKVKKLSEVEAKYKEIVSKETVQQQAAPKPPEAPPTTPSAQVAQQPQPQETPKLSPEDVNETYWASILRKKAELEVALNDLRDELNKSAIEVSELKKKNSDL